MWAHKFDIRFQLMFIHTQNKAHPPIKGIYQHATKSMHLTFWYTSTDDGKSNVAEKFGSEQMH